MKQLIDSVYHSYNYVCRRCSHTMKSTKVKLVCSNCESRELACRFELNKPTMVVSVTDQVGRTFTQYVFYSKFINRIKLKEKSVDTIPFRLFIEEMQRFHKAKYKISYK